MPRKWPEVLQAANVGGERKITLMLEQISEVREQRQVTAVVFSMSQLQQVRVVLERTRAECDECYCDNCYIEVHSGGKRSTHVGLAFRRMPKYVECVRAAQRRSFARIATTTATVSHVSRSSMPWGASASIVILP